jgi:hypothetical protein
MLMLGAAARGDVDLTGDWTVEYDTHPFGGIGASTETLTQTGSSLVWDDGGQMTGTIDATSGDFHVEGSPLPGGYPPPDARTGHAEDSDHLSGSRRIYVWMAGIFQPVDFAMRGIRPELVVCGDGVRDPGEPCDDGAANGTNQCCDASCALVDPDGDRVCTAVDDCPNDYNPDQEDVCTLPLTKFSARIDFPKKPDTSKVGLTATLTDPDASTVTAIPALRIVEPGNYDRTIADLVCVRKRGLLQCRTPDKNGTVKIKTRKTDVILQVKLKHAAVPPSPIEEHSGPITVSFIDQAGVKRGATATACGASGFYMICTQPPPP